LSAVIGAAPAQAAVRYQFSTEFGSLDITVDTFLSGINEYNFLPGTTCDGQAPCPYTIFYNGAVADIFSDPADDIGFYNGANGSSSTYFQLGAFQAYNSYASLPLENSAPGTLVVSQVGGAPEPAIWAMLILGFGLAGVALRRRTSPETGAAAA